MYLHKWYRKPRINLLTSCFFHSFILIGEWSESTLFFLQIKRNINFLFWEGREQAWATDGKWSLSIYYNCDLINFTFLKYLVSHEKKNNWHSHGCYKCNWLVIILQIQSSDRVTQAWQIVNHKSKKKTYNTILTKMINETILTEHFPVRISWFVIPLNHRAKKTYLTKILNRQRVQIHWHISTIPKPTKNNLFSLTHRTQSTKFAA